MHQPIAKLPNVYARAMQVLALIDRCYRRSRIRDAVLRMRRQTNVNRLVSNNKRFAVFLVPGMDIVNGGIMSICSIAKETQKLMAANGVSVAVCTAHGEPRLLRFTKFDNDVDIYAFCDLLSRFPSGSEVLVHVPELFLQKYVSSCLGIYRSRPDLNWRFNILLQNIDLTPPKAAVDAVQEIGSTTATIAHRASATAAQSLGCPVHFLSWGLSQENFEHAGYADKKRLIAISPDPHPDKQEIVRRMSEALPDHEIIEIRNMTYRKYKSVIKDAKFMFTFGEGLDGYFVESVFSGCVAMAIFSERFFTEDYRNLEGVFSDGVHAVERVAAFLRATNTEAAFRAVAARQYRLIASDFVWDKYVQNIRRYYEQYYPQWLSPR